MTRTGQPCPAVTRSRYKAWLQPSASSDSRSCCRLMVTAAWEPLLQVRHNKCKLLKSPIHRPLPSSRLMVTCTPPRLTQTLARASALVTALEIWLRSPLLLHHRCIVLCVVRLCAVALCPVRLMLWHYVLCECVLLICPIALCSVIAYLVVHATCLLSSTHAQSSPSNAGMMEWLYPHWHQALPTLKTLDTF